MIGNIIIFMYNFFLDTYPKFPVGGILFVWIYGWRNFQIGCQGSQDNEVTKAYHGLKGYQDNQGNQSTEGNQGNQGDHDN